MPGIFRQNINPFNFGRDTTTNTKSEGAKRKQPDAAAADWAAVTATSGNSLRLLFGWNLLLFRGRANMRYKV